MRLLVDENCASREFLAQLRSNGHDVESTIAALGAGTPDSAIVEYAIAESRVVVTKNADDFRQILGARRSHPGLPRTPLFAPSTTLPRRMRTFSHTSSRSTNSFGDALLDSDVVLHVEFHPRALVGLIGFVDILEEAVYMFWRSRHPFIASPEAATGPRRSSYAWMYALRHGLSRRWGRSRSWLFPRALRRARMTFRTTSWSADGRAVTLVHLPLSNSYPTFPHKAAANCSSVPYFGRRISKYRGTSL